MDSENSEMLVEKLEEQIKHIEGEIMLLQQLYSSHVDHIQKNGDA